MKYLIIIEKSKNGYGAYAPDFEGVGVVGDTKEEVMEMMKEAIEMHIEDLRKRGIKVPEPSNEAASVLV
jgi:predicted RNase H-like HicB family nuclease